MKSIITRLLALILIINIAGMVLIAVTGNFMSANSINEESLGRIGETTALNAVRIDSWLSNKASSAKAIAEGISVLPDINPDTVYPILVKHANSNADYDAVYIGYPDGLGVFSDDWEPDYSSWVANMRGWYTGAAASPNEAHITDLYVDATSGDVCLTFSMAITRGGALAGVVAIDIMSNVFNDVIANVDIGRGSYAFMTDGRGDIIVHNNSR